MRLGAQESAILTGTLARKSTARDAIHERHRHRFEFNNNYLERMQKAGFRSRRSPRTAWSRSSSCPRTRGSSACSSTRSSRRPARRPPAVRELRARGARARRRPAPAGGERVKLAGAQIGPDRPLFLIAGPASSRARSSP
jgi:hypothetical protein